MSTGKPIRSGQYRPDDYKFLSVPEEVSKLWEDILSYTAKEIELELPLKCFMPDYIPTTGDCDFMLKPTHPLNEDDFLGTRRLDEPGSFQSDPLVLSEMLEAAADEIGIEYFEEKDDKASGGDHAQQDPPLIENRNEVKDLCRFIVQFKPSQIELNTSLKCFIPEYIPAIGESFILLKPPRPDDLTDEVGTQVLMEPALIQSDPVTLSGLLEECENEENDDEDSGEKSDNNANVKSEVNCELPLPSSETIFDDYS